MTSPGRPHRSLAVPARLLTALLTLPLLAPLTAAQAHAAAGAARVAPAPGAPGVGDPYFPLDGNGGIDVQHYDIRTAYDLPTGRLRGRTELTLTPTADLSRFNLDFLLPVSRVTVDGRVAQHRTRRGHELVVRPAAPLVAGTPVRVRVRYAGFPGRERYAGERGWLADRREVVAMGEPHMAPYWFPANDHPTDKATYRIAVTVPKGQQAVANGVLAGRTERRGRTTWTWQADDPMTTYLAFFAAGRFRLERGVRDGLPWALAVSRRLPARDRRASMRLLRRTPAIVDRLEADLGEYPFTSTGGLVTSLDTGFALENQTRPTYPVLGRGDGWLLVHELAHQWFGDSVSVARWSDIWLNEGAATFMQVRDKELTGGRSTQEWLVDYHANLPARSALWRVRIGAPGAGRIFHWAVYERGAMAMQALRHRVGEDDFWLLLRTWLTSRAGGHATTEEFEALAEQVSGEDLDGFFDAWLRSRTKPAATTENGLV